MLIKRRTTKIANLQQKNGYSLRKIDQINKHIKHKDVQLSKYPLMQYFVSLLFFGLSIFLLYSAAGGQNSIPGFNMNLWWQYIIAFIPMLFGIIIVIVSQSEYIIFSRRDNEFSLKRKYFFCIIKSQVHHKFEQISGLSVIQKHLSNSDISNLYYIVITFKTCETYEVLGSISSLTILDYFQEMRNLYSEQQISHKKVQIKNLTV